MTVISNNSCVFHTPEAEHNYVTVVRQTVSHFNRPFSHSKFPCSLRELGKTKSIRTGASGSKCTRCIWTPECVITIRYRLFHAFSTVNRKKTSNKLNIH